MCGARIQVAYTHLLDRKMLPKLAPWLVRGTSAFERILFGLVKKTIAKGMISLMRCRYSRIPQAVEVMEAYFEELSARLEANGGQFLVGHCFTAADMSFACLSYPLIFPPEYADVMMPLAEMPDDFQAMVRKFRATPAGRHAMRCYAKHRFAPGTKSRQLVQVNRTRDVLPAGGIVAIICCLLLALYFFLSSPRIQWFKI